MKNAENVGNIAEISAEKEKIELIKNTMKMEKYQGTEITQEKFQEYLDEYYGTNNANGSKEGENDYIIEVVKTGNIYEITEEGTTEEIGNKADMKKDENPGVLEVDGNNYTINSIEDLVAFSYNVNTGTETYEGKTIKLGRNLFFNGLYDSYVNPDAKYEAVIDADDTTKIIGYKPSSATGTSTTTIKQLVTTETGFIPVGLVTGKTFKGEIDGQGCYLSGLYMNDTNDRGLFGLIESNMNISNLGIKNANIEASGPAGGFIVNQTGGDLTIDNCYFDGKITNSNILAGLVTSFGGDGNVTIKNSHCNANLSAASNTAGLIAKKSSTGNVVIENCYCEGKIENGIASGLISEIRNGNTQIANSYNKVNINSNGGNGIAGIVGDVSGNECKIENCYNEGKIYTSYGNGIAGIVAMSLTERTVISNSYNVGKINGNGRYTGGIIASTGTTAKIENCYNNGKIDGDGQAGTGGIVGHTNTIATINKCYNTGEINRRGENSIGGIIGSGANVEITNCYNVGNITGTSAFAGGISGQQATTIVNCYNLGNVIYKTVSSGGGIAPRADNIKYCYNGGNVDGGFISGIAEDCKNVAFCYNTGNVYGKEFLGGILGGMQINGNVDNCYNSGNIECENSMTQYCFAGGIGGYNCQITNSHNTGKIISSATDLSTGEIIGNMGNPNNPTDQVGADCSYLLRNDGSNAPAKGATGKTVEEMEEIMSIQNFVNTINTQIRENNANPDNVQLCEWTVKDGKPVLVWE